MDSQKTVEIKRRKIFAQKRTVRGGTNFDGISGFVLQLNY